MITQQHIRKGLIAFISIASFILIVGISYLFFFDNSKAYNSYATVSSYIYSVQKAEAQLEDIRNSHDKFLNNKIHATNLEKKIDQYHTLVEQVNVNAENVRDLNQKAASKEGFVIASIEYVDTTQKELTEADVFLKSVKKVILLEENAGESVDDELESPVGMTDDEELARLFIAAMAEGGGIVKEAWQTLTDDPFYGSFAEAKVVEYASFAFLGSAMQKVIDGGTEADIQELMDKSELSEESFTRSIDESNYKKFIAESKKRVDEIEKLEQNLIEAEEQFVKNNRLKLEERIDPPQFEVAFSDQSLPFVEYPEYLEER